MYSLNSFLPDKSAPDNVRIGTALSAGGNEYGFRLISQDTVSTLLKLRHEFSHKGTYGHALIIAGERETMGAALLASRGCVYGGSGLTTACIPESGLTALNTSLPEVMYLSREKVFNDGALAKYQALAIGPGLGTNTDATAMLTYIIQSERPVIADADALNIMASHKTLLEGLISDSILTPHIKEFDALFGAHPTWYKRIQIAIEKARELNIVIVLKNRYTFVIDQHGLVSINTSGDPAMAQGGMGDVLTGIVAAYVAQGYSSHDAAILGCYIHGAAGADLGLNMANVTATELARHLPIITKRLLKLK